MKTTVSRVDLSFVAGLLLVFPAAYFFAAAFLHENLHLSFFWNTIAPYFERPENKYLAWNADLLIAFGPVLAILLNLHHVLQIRLRKNQWEKFELSLTLQLNSIHWLVIFGAMAGIGVLIAYLLTENCYCL